MQDKITPKQYVDEFILDLQKSGFKPKMTILLEVQDEIIFEFSIDTPKNFQQDEIQKVVKGVDGFYILHYVIKKANMGEETRKKWFDILKNSTIKN